MKNKKLFDILKEAVTALKTEKCTFALLGGILVSGYRSDVRVTNDIDLMLLCGNDSSDVANKILTQLGYSCNFVKLHELKRIPMMNKKRAPALIAVGRSDEIDFGLDFILPAMPWFDNALMRAQKNLLDFGFGNIPCITVEDMIITKLYAGRAKDEDDLISIFKRKLNLDTDYLIKEMLRLQLKIPSSMRKHAPKQL